MKGPFHLTRFLRPLLDAAATDDDPARVINVGSIDGIQVPMMETYSYSTAKAGVHQLTRHLARHLAPEDHGERRSRPGPFESKMMAATLAAFGDSIAASAPMKRIGKPADMAGIAVYLAGPRRHLRHRRGDPRRRRHQHLQVGARAHSWSWRTR